jgi:hypothetical protein
VIQHDLQLVYISGLLQCVFSAAGLHFAYSRKWGSPGFRKTTLNRFMELFTVARHCNRERLLLHGSLGNESGFLPPRGFLHRPCLFELHHRHRPHIRQIRRLRPPELRVVLRLLPQQVGAVRGVHGLIPCTRPRTQTMTWTPQIWTSSRTRNTFSLKDSSTECISDRDQLTSSFGTKP